VGKKESLMSRVALTVAISIWTAAPLFADILSVGDPAPPLAVKEFVKGKPVNQLQKGKLYVVEFWATWCGPCKATIPHLTELQKKHKDVTFVGVSIWENDQAKVKPFVEAMADKMGYRVAVDDVSEKGARGKMATTWMDAATQEAIPTAFIINRAGKVAWVGSPGDLEKPLEEIHKGTWNLQAAAREFKKDQTRKLHIRELMASLNKAQKAKDTAAELQIINKIIAEDGGQEATLGVRKFKLLVQEHEDRALAYGKHLLSAALKDNAGALNNLAWSVVGPQGKKGDKRLVKLALSAAQRADQLGQGKNASFADTLAAAYAADGNRAKALEIEEKAAELARGTPAEKAIKEHLEQYRSSETR
jgi:thiol-disulfide isomerase/thioredoxin